MTESAAFKPAPARSDHIAAAPQTDKPLAAAQPSRPRPAGGLLRPSQVPPVPRETTRPAGSPSRAGGQPHHQLQRLRPSGAPASAALSLARPSAVPARPIPDVLRGPGQPLAAPLKEEMQARLGADLSDVRLHTGAAARASAAELSARAYTAGSHIVIGDNGTDTHTLAHELTHVIQQRTGPVPGTSHPTGFNVSDPFGAYEKAAEANATRVMQTPLSQHHPAAARTSGQQTPAAHPRGEREKIEPAHGLDPQETQAAEQAPAERTNQPMPDRSALRGTPPVPGGLSNAATLQRSIGCHPDPVGGGPQFQIGGAVGGTPARPVWTGTAAAMALGPGQARAHTIAFEVIQNDLAKILNSMLAAQGTPAYGTPAWSQPLVNLCDALFVTPGPLGERAAMINHRTALINTVAAVPPGPLTDPPQTQLTARAGDLLSDLNSCPDNLRPGNAAANQSIGYSIDAEFAPGTWWYTGQARIVGGVPPAAAPAAPPPGPNVIQGPPAGPGIPVGPIQCVRLTPAHESYIYSYQTHSTLAISFVISGLGGALFPGTAHGQHLSSTQMPTAHQAPVPFPVLVLGPNSLGPAPTDVPFLYQG